MEYFAMFFLAMMVFLGVPIGYSWPVTALVVSSFATLSVVIAVCFSHREYWHVSHRGLIAVYLGILHLVSVWGIYFLKHQDGPSLAGLLINMPQ